MENLLDVTARKISNDLAFMMERLRRLEDLEPKSDERRTLYLLIEKRRNMLHNVKRQIREMSSSDK